MYKIFSLAGDKKRKAGRSRSLPFLDVKKMWSPVVCRTKNRDLRVSEALLVTCLVVAGIVCCDAHIKLNVPRVRLPYFDTISVNFTLQVETPGCYQWSVTRPDVITITSGEAISYDHDGTECSSQVIISASPRISPCCPASAIVYVEDRVTKEMVRCDVIIDKIVSISIETTTKELHMEEAPSKFYVEGHGGKGDKFSTVDGVPFRWWLESVGPDTTVDPQSIMRFMSFSESTYQAPPGVAVLEANRNQGSSILVEGLKTGSARVFAKLTDPIYKNIPPAEVRIVVVANLQVDPREAYIVPDTQIPLRLRQIRHGKLLEIPLPSRTYSFEVLNTSVISYDDKRSIITALNYGSSDIVVKDKNALSDTSDMEHPEGLIAHINVREPRFLSLSVTPFRNWALRIGQEYEINVDIYDEENQKIYVSDNIQVETTFDPFFFNVISSSANGTYHVGIPIKTGSAPVLAELKHLKKLDGSLIEPSSSVRVKADMEIYQTIFIQPKETILPWDPNLQPKHDIRLTASGGNGNFFWTTTNTSVVTVTQNGVARSESLGFANVTAAMTINANIKGQARIYILPPTSMAILDHNVEAEVGVPILVPLAFYTVRPDDPTKTQVPFSRCHDFPFHVHVEDALFRYDEKTFYPASKPACTFLPITGSALGSSLVTVTYKIKDLTYTETVTVSTFKPLKVVEPLSQVTVLAVGSTRQLAFEGGPRPLLEKHGFYRTITVANVTVARATEIKTDTGKDDLYVYTVLCQEIGQTSVVLEVGNKQKQSNKNSRPIRRAADVTVICAEPAQIYFKVETSIKSVGSKCPSDASTAQVVRVAIPNYEDTRVAVTVKDIAGRKFDNITSLNIQWSTTPALADLHYDNYVITEGIALVGYETVGSSYQTIIPRGRSDPELEDSFLSERTHSMDLQLVSDVRVEPSSISLFNHAASQKTLKIVEGSGHFEYDLLGDGILSVQYFDTNKTLRVTPLNEGSAKIIVRDLCLVPRVSPEIDVQINGVGFIEIKTPDKIQVNHEANISVVVYDKGGNLLPPNILSIIKLKLSPIDTDILEVARLETSADDIRLSQRRFVIKGRGVGQITMTFTADGPGRIVRSPAKRITVFPPLTLRPKNVTLLVGSVYQIHALGGPQTDTNIIYKMRDRDWQDIASVTASGVIQGRKIGKTVVDVESVDRNVESTVYSEGTIQVQVVNLKGIRIHSPLTRIQSQKEMPLYVMGVSDEGLLDPTVLLGDKKALVYAEWSSNNHDSAEIAYSFQSNGYTPERGDQLSVRFKAKQPGRVTVKVFAVFNREQFIDEIEIEIIMPLCAFLTVDADFVPRLPSRQVYDELKLVRVPLGCQNLLMTPFSELNLRTNRDPSAKITYSVQPTKGCSEGSDCSRAVLDKPVISVDTNGIAKSNDVTGQAVVTVSVLEDFGIVLSLSVTIDVKPVSYLMISPQLPIALSGHEATSLPRGISFPFSISYHDNIGRKFDATSASPKIRTNRFDLIQLSTSSENNTFVAQANHEGRVCIKVYDRINPHVMDFLVLNVGEAIEPRLPMGVVQVGDVVCFSCIIKSKGLKEGIWVSQPTGLISLNPDTGIAVGTTTGLVRLDYTIPNVGPVTSVELNVVGIEQIRFDPAGTITALTNGDSNFSYEVFVILGDKKTCLFGNTCSEEQTKNITPPFSCSLRYDNVDIPQNVFSVRPVFVYKKQQYACRIQVLEQPRADLSLNYLYSDLILTAHVASYATHQTPGSYGREVRTEELRLAFNPALNIHTHELTIWSNDFYVGAELKITGLVNLLDSIQIAPSDGTLLRVEGLQSGSSRYLPYLSDIGSQKSSKPDKSKLETRTYFVYVQPDFWTNAEFDDRLKLFVTVFSAATNQQFTIPVKIKFRPPFMETPYNPRTLTGQAANLLSQANTWFFTPVFYFLVTVLVGHLFYRSIITARGKTQREADSRSAVFISRSDEDLSSAPKSPYFRDLNSRSSSGSPSSPLQHYSGGGDSIHTPLTSTSNSPLRSRLFSTQHESEYFGSPYVRK
ncbi:unnamed protein product [Allacma fusca]|uniref:Nuclear pore membrane glycoprotein 210 n=1 Tax=Allacma fusca TaxID=39272 RepID=A0A8J2KFX3_9HEXA|nr:unnamed protein product [Allacma fusca]